MAYEEETEAKPEETLEEQEGQASDSQGQSEAKVEPSSGQPPVEVELADGTRVSIEELKSGYLKDADYRRKTAEVADERRRVQQERESIAARSYSPQGAIYGGGEPQEEPEPLEVLAKAVVGLQTAYARDLLVREMERLAPKYSDADKKAVFAECWSNPQANIEEVMKGSHAAIQAKLEARASSGKAPATLDEFFKANPKAKEEYDRKREEEYLRKKAGKPSPKPAISSGSASAATARVQERPKGTTYHEVGEALKERFKEEKDESF